MEVIQRRRSGTTASIALALIITGCGQSTPETSALQFDSAHSVALDAKVTDASFVTATAPTSNMQGQIRDHLYYSIGYINGLGGVADLANRQVTVKSVDPVPGSTDLSRVTYDASFHIAWSRSLQIPTSIRVPVPERADSQGLSQFYQRYANACVEDHHELGQGNFWYYYRPNIRSCPLAGRTGNEPLTDILTIETTMSAINTQGKFPEYSKIWEDQRLVVTAVFSKFASGGTNGDVGVDQFNAMYASLLNTFGRPATSNVTLRRNELPGTAHPDLRFTWNTQRGVLDVNVLLVDTLSGVPATFIEHFNRRTQNSDLVAYNGHSGLGANIRFLGRMGTFTPGQYQIYYINGCDTFAYVGNEISEAHHAVNPEAAPSKYVDIITNAMPSPFSALASSTMNLIVSLYNQRSTYRQILATINSGQNPNVTGEEDNQWPNPFVP